MKDTDDLVIAHVELANARFTYGEDLGIEFKNQIDAWKKMEVHFRQQIRNPRKKCKLKSKHDLNPLVYAIREKLD